MSRLRTTVAFGLVAVAGLASVDALARREWRPVAAAAALVVATVLAAEALRRILPRPYLGDFAYVENTYPSGHAALAFAAVIAVAWLRPPWLRPWVVMLLGAGVVFVGIASLTSFAHRASDIAGSVLLTASLAAWVVVAGREPPPPPAVHDRRWQVVAGVAIVLAAACAMAAALGPAAWVGQLLRTGTAAAVLGAVTLVVSLHLRLRQRRRP